MDKKKSKKEIKCHSCNNTKVVNGVCFGCGIEIKEPAKTKKNGPS